MKIFPAIDLYQGKAVRLYKGDYAQMTVYDDDPLRVAHQFEDAGARYVHIVDLEGARNGSMPNFEIVRRIARETGLFVELGGGMRSMDAVERCLNGGIHRAILGTAAITDGDFTAAAVDKFGPAIAVGADVRDGKIAIHGWTKSSGMTLDSFCLQFQQLGVRTLICTDISRDGALSGTNRQLYQSLQRRFSMNIIASGGISTLEDVRALAAMDLHGAIIGRACYTGDIDLRQAIEVAK